MNHQAPTGASGSAPTRPVTVLGPALYCLAGVQFTQIADFMVLMPLAPALMRNFGVGPAAIATLVSSYTFASAVAGLLAALWIDRVNRRRALLVLYSGFIVATLACGVAPGYFVLLLARSAAGAFGGVLGSLAYTIVGEAVPESHRGRATGILMSSFSLATVAGVPIALLLSAEFGWHAPFLFLGALSCLVALALARGLPDLPRPAQAPGATTAWLRVCQALADRDHQRAFIWMALMTSSAFLVIPFISIHLNTNVGVAESQLPVLYLIGGAVTFLSARAIGVAADRFGKVRTYRVAALASMVPLWLITHLPAVPLAAAIASAALFFVLISGRMVPAMALVTSSARPDLRGTFMSLNTTVQAATQGLAALLGGLIVARSPEGRLLNFAWNGWAGVVMTAVAIVWAGRLRARTAGAAERAGAAPLADLAERPGAAPVVDLVAADPAP
jgi:predicted MFS family arabinose efflux permease